MVLCCRNMIADSGFQFLVQQIDNCIFTPNHKPGWECQIVKAFSSDGASNQLRHILMRNERRDLCAQNDGWFILPRYPGII